MYAHGPGTRHLRCLARNKENTADKETGKEVFYYLYMMYLLGRAGLVSGVGLSTAAAVAGCIFIKSGLMASGSNKKQIY